jgi:hypothetical protein
MQIAFGAYEDDYWRKVSLGNKETIFNYFINHIINDSDFRSYFANPYGKMVPAVSNFIGNFHFLLSEASKCGPDTAILRDLEYSAMGSVYLALCVANGMPEKTTLRKKPSSLQELKEGA